MQSCFALREVHRGIVRPLEFGGVRAYRLIRSGIINWRPGKVFYINFNDKASREEHKTIYSGLGISGLTGVFQSSVRQYKNSYQFQLTTSWNCSSQKMA
jgi:hypothetical protein